MSELEPTNLEEDALELRVAELEEAEARTRARVAELVEAARKFTTTWFLEKI